MAWLVFENNLLGGDGGDNTGSVPWHILNGEVVTIPTRRQVAVHGFILNEGEIILQGSAQLVVQN